jgi:acyl transferase domain-containing protein
MNSQEILEQMDGSEVAVIGMVCRFPGAKDTGQFWENLRNGVHSITFLTDEQLEPSGVDPAVLNSPNYIKAASLLEDIDLFDASFFGFTPKEAEVMDPQHRVFLECAWEALERSGYDPETYEGAIGIFSGARTNSYLFNIYSNLDLIASLGAFQIGLGNDLAFLSTRVSYKLNLKGPSYPVHTACSTALVAVHLACQSLLVDECQMALAGGIAINVPQKTGYMYQHGGIVSPDGFSRTFDAKAQGTVFGSGIGIVVLKRLEEALADGDSIHAIIKGSAINNDGSSKASFTAPSVQGQTEVISEALANAGVGPESITYVEAHGTGTALGDPIEVRALTKAFASSKAKNYCAIGSVKTNFGHLDAAAGIAGFIKTVLALEHKQIPPSLHFEEPNPQIDFANSPFYVNSSLSDWKANGTPRRAGVSAFGVGGTNAHVILEEAPALESSGESRPYQMLVVSAKSPSGLEAARLNLANHLKSNPGTNLADVAFTLKMGRRAFPHRLIAICSDVDNAVNALDLQDPKRAFVGIQEISERAVMFMFPGAGAQYVNMGRELYQLEPLYRREVDACAELLKKKIGYDLREILLPATEKVEEVTAQLLRTSVAMPALFVTEYALARLWMSWGIAPKAMIGHSLGEYVAACLAGVFSLEDALSLVVLRGQLLEQLPSGAMLSVPLPEDEVRALINDSLSVAAVNGPSACVISGPSAEIRAMEGLFAERGDEVRRLHVDVALHSEMVTQILPAFTDFVRGLQLNAPAIPFVSSVTGIWITDDEAADPNYWARHLRQTVRFCQGVGELLKDADCMLLEVGPGQTLSMLTKLQTGSTRAQTVLSSMRHPLDTQSDEEVLLTTLGRLWLAGVDVDWAGFYDGQGRRRIPLPTYPFERQRYWVEARNQIGGAGNPQAGLAKQSDITKWFYVPSWKKSLLPGPFSGQESGEVGHNWLVFGDESGLGVELVSRLVEKNQAVSTVLVGSRFTSFDENAYTIDPHNSADYEALFEELVRQDKVPDRIIHLWSVTTENGSDSSIERFKRMQYRGYYSLLFLAQALEKKNLIAPLRLQVVTNHLHEVTGGETTFPEKATLLGACKVIPQEYPNITCKAIDVVVAQSLTHAEMNLTDHLLSEFDLKSSENVIAYRANQRWVQIYEPAHFESSTPRVRPLRENGVYLITGGLGGVGRLLAEHLAETLRAKLILTGRSAFPAMKEWEQWLASHDDGDEISRKIQKLKSMQEHGAEVIVRHADAADESSMSEVVNEIYDRFGRLDGVLHTAGVTSGASVFNPIPQIGPAESESQFQPKAYGVYVLEKVLRGRSLDFCLLFSSNASVLGGLGFVAYAAANAFMDGFAMARGKAPNASWISASWDHWPEETRKYTGFQTSIDQYTMTPDESVKAFTRAVCMSPKGHIAVATGDLNARLALWVNRQPDGAAGNSNSAATAYPRSSLLNTYVAPRDEHEQTISELWQQILGMERVGINDNFFDLGGHSLLVTRLVNRMCETYQLHFPIQRFFEAPTVAGQAAIISKIQAEQEDREKMEILEMLAGLSEEEAEIQLDQASDLLKEKMDSA